RAPTVGGFGASVREAALACGASVCEVHTGPWAHAAHASGCESGPARRALGPVWARMAGGDGAADRGEGGGA
ncbi:MAG: hypothetical protein ACO3O6_03020, partial [Gemmobacter sp.]